MIYLHCLKHGLRDCQVTAINNLEKSFKDNTAKGVDTNGYGFG